jgi:CPA2 family monovalent cation:H+ antiporter-2
MPLLVAFSVLFLVSVGMQADPTVFYREPWMVVGVLGLILVGKSIVALGIVLAMGYPLSTALVASASLAQIGEFSFILGGLGIAHGLFSQEGLNLILAGSLVSISLNPLAFTCADRLTTWLLGKPRVRARFEDARAARFARLTGEMDAARRKAEERAEAHKTFTPEGLVVRFPLFSDLTADQREVLVLHFQQVTAQPGERIIRKGDKADRIYFVSQGQVEVAAAGKRIRLGPGDYFGEMALISGKPRSADVTALDYGTFETLSQRDFRMFLKKFPSLRERVLALAAERGEMNRQFLESAPDAPPEPTAQAP